MNYRKFRKCINLYFQDKVPLIKSIEIMDTYIIVYFCWDWGKYKSVVISRHDSRFWMIADNLILK